MFILTTLIFQCIEHSSQGNKENKKKREKKRYIYREIRKEELKLSLLADDIIATENFKESSKTKKLLGFMSEFSKASGFKINI